MTPAIIEMKRITKEFNHIRVLDHINFELLQGEIHALLGENGAGKSTLMKILRGIYQPEEGEILINGKAVTINSPSDSRLNGISMVFQEFSLIPSLTVAQNIFLTRESRSKLGLINDRIDEKKASILLHEMGVDLDPSLPVEQLSTGYRQLTEIVAALSQDAQILILDEPTASLTHTETMTLFGLLRKLKERGISIIYISHRMEEIFQIADRITVLRDGKNIITEQVQNLSIQQVIEHILGHKDVREIKKSTYLVDPTATPLLEVNHLNCNQEVCDVSFKLFAGEVLGLAGLMGSGRTELVQTIFGITPAQSGDIKVKGKKVRINDAKSGMKAKIAFIPEDRRLQGLSTMHSIKENFELPLINLRKLEKHKIFVDDHKIVALANGFVEKLQIKCDSIDKEIRLLSGGNQQKVVIAKWLSTEPDILIMDEPTAGVDIGTKTEILEMARNLANEGKGVVIISSELQELLSISDRIVIIKNGSIVDEMLRTEVKSEDKLHQIIQGAQASV
ncbi:MAG: sugar ABC transporter ATP-binding protein [Chloroflexi bacterium HGW-Chloroflexi-4]|jgi:ribose transport system ATP-binding protein|nr:MAG: sugar ABC transporter ATP-binding protein [Chloroflexi bacterium HGW-Chloroflexi-4]